MQGVRFVFRVENKQKLGPYIHMRSERWRTRRHSNSSNHPGPERDILLSVLWEDLQYDRDSIVFGFSSLTQLKKWFTKKELTNLHRLGFSIYRVPATTVYQGDKQVCFVRHETKRRKKVSL